MTGCLSSELRGGVVVFTVASQQEGSCFKCLLGPSYEVFACFTMLAWVFSNGVGIFIISLLFQKMYLNAVGFVFCVCVNSCWCRFVIDRWHINTVC